MTARNIFGALVVGLALFSFWPFVVGKWQQVGALRQALAERETLVQERQASLNNIANELERYRSELSGADATKFSAMVTEHRDTAGLISAIDAIATGNGVSLTGIEAADPRQAKDAATRTVLLTMELSGSYRAFKGFLSQLETSARLLNVTTINASEDERQPGQQNYTVTAEAYYLQ